MNQDQEDSSPDRASGRVSEETSLSPDINFRSEVNGRPQLDSVASGDSGFGSRISQNSPSGASVNNVSESLRLISIDPVDLYKMNHSKRGKCIIFNNKDFAPKTGMNPRPGTDVDAKNMYEVFQRLGFDVDLHHNQETLGMVQKVAEAAAEDHRNSDCFVMVILSHGGENDHIYGTNGSTKLDDLVAPLKGNVCPSLVGKPKLIFVQACRGTILDDGVNVTDARPDLELPEVNRTYKLPVEADFLYAFSSPPGQYSFRNSKNGSWFIQAIKNVFTKHGTSLEIMQLMTRVNRMVAYEFESKSLNPLHSGKKQIPSIVSMLTKELYFPKPR